MNKRRFITIFVLSISLVVAIVTTFSYAYWTKSVNQTGENEITALGCFEIEYTDTEEISISDAYPISDEKGKNQEIKYTFTIRNTCDVWMNLQINFESLDVSGKALPDNYVKAYLTSVNRDIKLTKLTNDIKVDNVNDDVINTYKLTTNKLGPNATRTYELRIWVSSDVEYTDDSYNATFKGKVHIVPSILNGNPATLKSTSLFDESAFRSDEYIEKLKNISFEDSLNIPDEAVEQWDIGVEQDNIFAYVVSNQEDNNYYDLHIQSDVPIIANENMSYWFSRMVNLDSITGLEVVDFSTTTNMSSMLGGFFYGSNYENYAPGFNSSIFTVDISSIDTSNVTDMSCMFFGLGENSSNFELDVSHFNTINVTNMFCMFGFTGYVNPSFTLDVSHFNTSKVTNMADMFDNTGHFSTIFDLDVSNFDTSKVTDMSYMFYQYYNDDYNDYQRSTVIQLDVSNFDTRNVTNMEGMFCQFGYSNINLTLDVSNFDTSKVTNMGAMFEDFAYTSTVIDLDVSNFDTSNVTNMDVMFFQCGRKNPNFSLDVSNFDTSNVFNMNSMFAGAGYNNSSFNLDLSNWNTSNVTNMYRMFRQTGYNNYSLNIDLSSFDTSNVTDMAEMFADHPYLKIKFGDNFNTSNVTTMRAMFSNVNTLEFENYQIFNTSNVRIYGGSSTFDGMFNNCNRVNLELDIQIPSIANSENYRYMFNNAAISSGSEIVVNYTSENETLVTNMVNTKSGSSNVSVGDNIGKTITINDSNVTSNVSVSSRNNIITLSTSLENKIIKSFKVNGDLVNGNTFIMPNANVVITDVVFVDGAIIESSHNPYDNNLNQIYYEHTFTGATSITVTLTYQTEGIEYDYIYLYSDVDTIYGGKYGGMSKKTQSITIPGDYIKIKFISDMYDCNYYGFKAIISANYD